MVIFGRLVQDVGACSVGTKLRDQSARIVQAMRVKALLLVASLMRCLKVFTQPTNREETMNQCQCCGKFKKWDELVHQFIPDSDCSAEQSWYECKKCLEKNKP